MHPSITELLLLGLGVGAFGTLIGAGGGFILVPVLAIIYPDAKSDLITSISLAIVFLNATSGSVAYGNMRRIDYKSAVAFGIATLPGSVIGAILTGYVPRHAFNMILGSVLVIIAIFLFIKPGEGAYAKKEDLRASTHRSFTDKLGNHYDYYFNIRTGIILSFFVGFLSSFLGIGGGIIHVPALISLLNFPAHVATATSHFVLAIMALSGTIVHLVNGTMQEGLRTALFIGIGVITGAQIGAYFSNKVKAKGIVKALAVALVIVGLRLLFG
ncbi:sulfite exporter TauE/SafE family protein [Parafilimonas sp.]|uniref:sulfite exporter TauE/SafE family protein n=1 Tax=Parafilimonas sp. TaxID=1969739 RepID=UPI003F823DE6